MLQFPSLGNIFGFMALLLYIATLLPGIIRVINPKLLRNKIVLNLNHFRRQIGILAFLFALSHGIWMVYNKGLSLSKFETYLKYWPGFTMLFIFTLLAITSNEWSVKHLKNNWKKLHQLTFLVMFLLLYHIIDKVKNWTYLTPIGLFLVSLGIFLFMVKKFKEFKKISVIHKM